MMVALSVAVMVAVLALAADALRTRTVTAARWEWAAVAAITAVAVAMRALWLAQSSLEHLEASYLFEAIKPAGLWDMFTSRQSAEQMHQPLYPLILRGWARISLSEAWLRTPSVIMTAACVPLVWSLVRDELGAVEALEAAALTAVAPLLVWYGRDCTPYALLALMSLTAVVSARQQLASPSRYLAVRTGVALALAFYTHFHGGWVAITVGLWLLITLPAPRRGFWETTAATAVLCLPWVPALFNKLLVSVQGLTEDRPIMQYSHRLDEAASEALRVLVGGPTPAWALCLVAILIGTIYLFQRKSRLAWLITIAAGIGLLAELHIAWQLQRSKGILYIDIRHYIYLAPLLLIPVAAMRRHVVFAVVLILQLWVSGPMVTSLEKPDVRRAVEYIHKYAAVPTNAIAFLPAPWYQPIVEFYLTGPCPDLVHGRSREGWWQLKDCYFSEEPIANSVYGYPPDPDRVWASARRTQLDQFWVIKIRDHRFGLPVPPTEPQERFMCWKGAQKALVGRREFGPWVTVHVYDRAKLHLGGPPPPARTGPARTVTAAEAWEQPCASRGSVSGP